MTLITPSDPAKKAKATGYYLLPAALRNFVRSRETGLVSVAIVIGLLSGLLVAAISKLSEVAHALLFDIPFDAHLSSTGVIPGNATSAGLVPVIASAVTSWLVARHLTHQQFLLVPGFPSPVSVEMIGQTVLIGVICAFASII